MIILTAFSIGVVAMILLRVAFFVLFVVRTRDVPTDCDRHVEMRLSTLTFIDTTTRSNRCDCAQSSGSAPLSELPTRAASIYPSNPSGNQLRSTG